jgi:BirA family biotin operon repressor/biotin-[acetyl-CoA-carboxylase] ligase
MIFTNLIQTNLRTKVFGKKIEYYQRIGSTNEEAWELINTGEADHGTMVITDNQFSGKGRDNNDWYMSPSKSLAMSIIIKDEITIEQALLVPLAAGLAVAKTLKNRSFKPQLKWPNDILLNSKKCGGILCESRVQKNKITEMVIGIGLNVNDQKSDLNQGIQNIATSLLIESGYPNQRELISAIITTYFEQVFDNLSSVTNQWLDYCYHLNKKIKFKYMNDSESGVFKGISDKGFAKVEIENQIKEFPSITIDYTT